MSTCYICGLTYDDSSPDDRILHRNEHKKLATGIQPRVVREFQKAFGWEVARNSIGDGFHNNSYAPEVGKLVVVYAWWSRALQSGVPIKDFDAYMAAHLKLVDALISGENEKEARRETQKWERYAG